MVSVGPEGMSPREAEVLEAVGEALTNAEIGRRLHISVRTVESHVSSLLRKLDAGDRRDLMARAAAVLAPAVIQELAGLPSTWTSFVGRTTELGDLSKAIATNRLVTLVGPGGVGKTRLAVVAATKAASTFPAGGAFVDLVGVSSDFVIETVAAALGVVERAQEPLEQAVLARLRAGRVLVVLDNCEHLLGAAATFTRSVLASCPEAVVLATSRERLGVAGETVLALHPLTLSDTSEDGGESEAELLFVQRATSPAGDPALIAEICRRLDGMPLAIELAAARSSSLGLDGLLAGLDDHLRLLSRSSASGDRHGSMRTVIAWSHQLLDDEERAMFRRLGLFAGAFDLIAAATVAGDGDVAATSDVIGRLTDKSLLVHQPDVGASRWRMLDTVHAFAREQLQASGEQAEIRHRYLDWTTATARQLERSLDDGGDWRERFDAVADDLRAALATADPDPGDGTSFDLALALGHLSYARRFLVEARDHLSTAVDRAPDEESAVAALRVAASAAFAEMRGEAAFVLLQAAFRRAAAAGDRRSASIALAQSSAIGGRCPALFVEPLTSQELAGFIEEARALAPPDDLEVATYLALAAAWDGSRGPSVPDPIRAKQALALARQWDDPVLISNALDAVSGAAAYDGCYKEASRLTRERIELLDRLPRHHPSCGGEVADIFHMATESALAAGELDAALAGARRSHDDSTNQGLAHFSAAHLVIPLVLQGGFDQALRQATVMREGWAHAGSPTAGWMAPSFYAAAMVHGLRGDEDAYADWWHLATTVRMKTRGHSFSLFVEPRVALHLGALDRARAAVIDGDGDMIGQYGPYARAISVEVAVATGAPEAEARLDAAWHLAAENDFVAAQLLRASGRLHGDESALEKAVDGWEAIGARFERACTLVLIAERAAEGAAELEALGCPMPAP